MMFIQDNLRISTSIRVRSMVPTTAPIMSLFLLIIDPIFRIKSWLSLRSVLIATILFLFFCSLSVCDDSYNCIPSLISSVSLISFRERFSLYVLSDSTSPCLISFSFPTLLSLCINTDLRLCRQGADPYWAQTWSTILTVQSFSSITGIIAFCRRSFAGIWNALLQQSYHTQPPDISVPSRPHLILPWHPCMPCLVFLWLLGVLQRGRVLMSASFFLVEAMLFI